MGEHQVNKQDFNGLTSDHTKLRRDHVEDPQTCCIYMMLNFGLVTCLNSKIKHLVLMPYRRDWRKMLQSSSVDSTSWTE